MEPDNVASFRFINFNIIRLVDRRIQIPRSNIIVFNIFCIEDTYYTVQKEFLIWKSL